MGAIEDDGWLLTLVHDEGSGTSELIVVNAQDVTSGPVAQVLIPQRVPMDSTRLGLMKRNSKVEQNQKISIVQNQPFLGNKLGESYLL